MTSSVARTSIPPVLSLGFSLPGIRGATVPLMPTTYSLRSSLACACSSAPGVRLEDDLSDPVAVAKVDEQQPAEVAPGVDPAVQTRRAARRAPWSIRRKYEFVSVAWEDRSSPA